METKNIDLPINVVLVQEQSRGRNRVDWLLLTNQPISIYEEVMAVVRGYTQRWRIEELHKTWKTGACRLESAQLHTSERLIRWATVLITVAARIERLKRLARSSPELSAAEELTRFEIEALVLLKSRRKKKGEEILASPTIAQATLWIAELGGYTGKSSGGPAGSITIARGLERSSIAAEVVALQKLR